MKIKSLLSTLCVMFMAATAFGQTATVNLTPKPKSLIQGTGTYVLPNGLTVGGANLDAEWTAEADAFVSVLNKATGLNATVVATPGANISIAKNETLAPEGYKLTVSDNGVAVEAATTTGLYYAFQSIRKVLPANVMAEKLQEGTYELPVMTIDDEPRFEYRGFMLDVSRHFFDVETLKKMLDVMAVYKLNRFHWHLTDDQGWRLPMPKWPKLTVEGATNSNVLLTDFEKQTQVAAGKDAIYGPFSYTEAEIRDIVAYAKARHIEVIPEIDMPGHMVAAIHAYPELSTDPEGKTYDHAMWNRGGISNDVLDVSNPRVLEFTHDVIDVLADLFPYNYIHIGGDECPTKAWEKSAACQAKKTELNLSDYHGLQRWFTKQVADYAKTKGRKVMGWNELVTSGSADMDLIKEIDPTIFCWTGGEGKCEQNGIKHIYTGFNGGYYINRSYAGYDKVGAVGDGALSTTLTVNPPLNSNCIGVQGTFWTEQVDRPTDVEYLALPRLIGIAEQGWSPVEKDTDEILARIIAEKEYLDLAGYNYGAHQLVMPDYMTPDPEKWYYISSNASDERQGNVLEILAEGHNFISSKSGKGAKALRLWGCKKSDGNEYQQFRFIEDPDNAGYYAIVCRALPNGSLSSTPTGQGLTDRWDYKANELDYGFRLDKAYYNENTDGTFRYAIRPAAISGYYLNFARDGQGQAINIYNNPNDGNGGHMVFSEATPAVEVGEVPAPGKFYRLHTRFNADQNQARYGSVIELLRDDAGKGNNAQANRLWSNAPAAETDDNYDYQWFTFEADPAGSQYYAMVCKAKPEGSVNSVPTGANNANTARWDYDNSTKHYGFYLVDSYNGVSVQGTDSDGFYSALTSKDAANGWYMNVSAAGQGFSVHLWSMPNDQNAGIFTFEQLPEAEEPGEDPGNNDDPQAGISEVNASTSTSEIYDLQGRKLTKHNRAGIYIVNGHKVLVK